MTTVAILGAGPVGLAAAAHVLERGFTPLVLEQGPRVGHGLRQWAHVELFSHWGLNMDPAALRLLTATGWKPPPPSEFPTAGQMLAQYLEPLAAHPRVAAHILTGRKVVSIARQGLDKVVDLGRAERPFELVTTGPGGEERFTADAVIDATGTWFSPNPGGASGIPVPGEAGNPRIVHGMPEIRMSDRYVGKRVAVLGGGHSAVGNLIDLATVPGATPVWLYRGDSLARAFGGGAADRLAQRGALGTAIAELVRSGRVQVETSFRLATVEGAAPLALRASDGRQVDADELIVATGFRPDLSFLRELRVALDPALECPPVLAPLIDPNLHSCGTVRPHGARELAHPEAGFYIVGMKSYGRAPTFLMATGYEQVRSVVAEIAGDHAAAGRVELILPETGVCNGRVSQPVAPVAKVVCC